MENQSKLFEKIDSLDTPPQVKALLKSLTDPEVQQRINDLHALLTSIEERNKPAKAQLRIKRDVLVDRQAKKEAEFQ